MSDRRYPIHSEPGVAWVLEFDARASKWLVVETRDGPKGRVRVPLADFEAASVGKPIAALIAAAVAQAAADA